VSRGPLPCFSGSAFILLRYLHVHPPPHTHTHTHIHTHTRTHTRTHNAQCTRPPPPQMQCLLVVLPFHSVLTPLPLACDSGAGTPVGGSQRLANLQLSQRVLQLQEEDITQEALRTLGKVLWMVGGGGAA
jgi:hypothetical protein